MSNEPPDYLNDIPPLDNGGCSDGIEMPFRVQSLGEFAVLMDCEWHINGILPTAELIVGYGQPGSGKTFAILDMVMAVARGVEWNGRRVNQGRVVYICAEGSNGFRRRLVAYSQHNNLDFQNPPSFEIIANAPNFLNNYDMAVVAQNIGKSDIIVIDTLARIMAGGDENSSEDMGRVISQCQALHRLTGATIILIHHSGKDEQRGSRGWSGLLGAADAEFKVEKFPTCHKLSNTKQKDAELFQSIGFTLSQIVIGKNQEGENITSCTFELCEPPKTLDAAKKLGTTEQLVVDIFKEFQSYSVPFEDLVDRVIKNIPHDSIGGKRDRRRDMVKQAVTALQSKKLYAVTNNLVHKA